MVGGNPVTSQRRGASPISDTVVTVNSDNRINLKSIDLNAGQYLPLTIEQAWSFLTSEYFRGEHNIQAQPWIALSITDSKRNYTTPWNFKPSETTPPPPISSCQLQLFFAMRPLSIDDPDPDAAPWGCPNPEGPASLYYVGTYQQVANHRKEIGDKTIYLVNAGWIDYSGVYSSNSDPTVEGRQKVAGYFESWPEEWWWLSLPWQPELMHRSFKLA
ncbi:uncharacterized protein EDB91DRAFT_1080717 [Suillus paluster]|uniref:uncharacterized protein n=1 Tax=Suillus paluster TaxID=48578 RepID=UPI001B862E8B|nr:uncharacterized protein EDB91DRAFT_1080717 [Suillus paluster]KAG1744619.1 hypothetical protein EDB91DRAFT_1080717 [Suillus paluster]